jgi:hypothetical protein
MGAHQTRPTAAFIILVAIFLSGFMYWPRNFILNGSVFTNAIFWILATLFSIFAIVTFPTNFKYRLMSIFSNEPLEKREKPWGVFTFVGITLFLFFLIFLVSMRLTATQYVCIKARVLGIGHRDATLRENGNTENEEIVFTYNPRYAFKVPGFQLLESAKADALVGIRGKRGPMGTVLNEVVAVEQCD